MTAISEEIDENLSPEAKTLIAGEGYQITNAVKDLKVRNKAEYDKAVAIGVRNRNIIKSLETLRKALTAPFNDQIKKINSQFRKAAEMFNQNQGRINKLLGSYQDKVKTENIQTTRVHDVGRATIKKVMKFEVIDPDKVPREFLTVDEVKIGRAVRGRVTKEIPGVKIWEENQTTYAAE